ncbi:MAG: PASTA domain-containing protein [candidate division WOR-3 bacterium]
MVPNVVGMDRAAAIQTITQSGFRLGEVRTVSDPAVPTDRVVAQYPPGGRFSKPGRAIQLDVSRGPDRVTVPDVVGMSLDQAQAELSTAGLLVGEVESLRTPSLPLGRVVAIRPSAGTEAERLTPVVIAVSAPVGSFPMPNLLGVNLETASGILASQGLILGEVRHAPSGEPAGIVLVQYPEEGMPVRDGDTARLIVAAPAQDSTP